MQWFTRAIITVVTVILSTNLEARTSAQQLGVPEVVMDWDGDPNEIIKQYESTLKQWAQRSCSPRVRQQFQNLYKDYRAAGFYIPVLEKSQIDIKTVKENLSLIEKKLTWLKSLKKDLTKSKKLASYESLGSPLLEKIDDLLELRKKFELESKKRKREQIRRQSQQKLKALEQEYANFTKKIPFLLSFGFPVDHFANRFEYEKLRSEKKTQAANAVFFRRQVFEDGALDPDHSQSDLYLRTTLDTLAIQLKTQADFLNEPLRYDLEWVLPLIKSQLDRGKKIQMGRLGEWIERTENELSFYRKLLNQESNRASSKVVADKSEATARLRDYVYKKHAATYEFFARQPDVIQALFVFDQILLNEVGAATADNYRDRRDVGQIVINRRYHRNYANLDPNETLYSYLKRHTQLKNEEINKSKWLNVMFKEEQFSFTLYFIPAVQMVFCPDFYKTARSSRTKNMGLALDLLKHPNTDFKATRYFSRFSMVGKIDMAQMWDGYVPLPPSPGRSLTHTPALVDALKKNLYRYLYDFIGTDGRKYHVIEIGKQTYVVNGLKAKPQFFNYRNPHSFSYFEEKPNR